MHISSHAEHLGKTMAEVQVISMFPVCHFPSAVTFTWQKQLKDKQFYFDSGVKGRSRSWSHYMEHKERGVYWLTSPLPYSVPDQGVEPLRVNASLLIRP